MFQHCCINKRLNFYYIFIVICMFYYQQYLINYLHVQFFYESKWDRIATVSTDFQEFFFSFQTKREASTMTFDLEKKKLEQKKCKIHVRWREVKDLHFSFLSSLFDFDIDIDVDIWHSKSTTEISILQVNC